MEHSTRRSTCGSTCRSAGSTSRPAATGPRSREARTMRSKTDLALEMVRAARTRGMRFGWVGVDGGYGKGPAFLRALDDMGETFVADVHCDQRVWSEPPGLHVPAPKAKGQRRLPSKQQAAVDGIAVDKLVAGFGADDWTRCTLRESTRGPLRVDIAHRRVWLWDGEEATARCWHLLVRREVGAPKRIKYSLSNAPADTPLERLAEMQGERYWVERAFEDAKGECGLADYQAVGQGNRISGLPQDLEQEGFAERGPAELFGQ